MSINSSLNVLVDIAEKRDAERTAFIKHVLLMSSSLFGFLIALHKHPISGNCTRMVFVLALISLSLGILLLSVALYQQLFVYKEQFQKQKAEILLQLRHQDYQPKPIFGNPPKYFELFEKSGYISLSLSIVFLAIYGIMIA